MLLLGTEYSPAAYLFWGSGILFSICICILRAKEIPWFYKIAQFIFLIFIFFISILCGIATWGMTLPFIGGVGAILVCYTLNFTPSAKIDGTGVTTFFIRGLLSGLIGLIIYFSTSKIINQETGFCIIVLIWQSVIGFHALKHVEINNTDNIEPPQNDSKNTDPDNIYSGKSETFRKWVIKKRF